MNDIHEIRGIGSPKIPEEGTAAKVIHENETCGNMLGINLLQATELDEERTGLDTWAEVPDVMFVERALATLRPKCQSS